MIVGVLVALNHGVVGTVGDGVGQETVGKEEDGWEDLLPRR